MEPFKKVRGKILPLPRADVDTDQIIPAKYLKRIERTGFGEFAFDAWRKDPNFVLNDHRYDGAEILVTGPNFGCGSSREHAPWALQQGGFKAVVAPSFADIFFNNSFKNGFLPIALKEEEVAELFRQEAAAKGAFKLTIDLAAQTVTPAALVAPAKAGAQSFHFDIDATRRTNLLNGWDEIGLTLRHAEEIKAYEEKRKKAEPWIFS